MSFEPEEWNLAPCAEFLGADRILWASDYPHPEYHPGLVKEVVERVEPLPPEDQAEHPRPERQPRVPPRPVSGRDPLTFDRPRWPARSRAHARRAARASRGRDAGPRRRRAPAARTDERGVRHRTQGPGGRDEPVAASTGPSRSSRPTARHRTCGPGIRRASRPSSPPTACTPGFDSSSTPARRRSRRRWPTSRPAGRLAVDELTMPLRAALAGRELVDPSVLLGQAKVQKTADEIECIRRAQRINEVAIDRREAARRARRTRHRPHRSVPPADLRARRVVEHRRPDLAGDAAARRPTARSA